MESPRACTSPPPSGRTARTRPAVGQRRPTVGHCRADNACRVIGGGEGEYERDDDRARRVTSAVHSSRLSASASSVRSVVLPSVRVFSVITVYSHGVLSDPWRLRPIVSPGQKSFRFVLSIFFPLLTIFDPAEIFFAYSCTESETFAWSIRERRRSALSSVPLTCTHQKKNHYDQVYCRTGHDTSDSDERKDRRPSLSWKSGRCGSQRLLQVTCRIVLTASATVSWHTWVTTPW